MRRVGTLVFVILATMLPRGAATTLIWSGATGGSYSTGTNWVGDTAPTSGASVEFTSTVDNRTVSFTGPGTTTVGAITFSGSSRPTYTFGGTGSPTLELGDTVTLATAGDVTFVSTLGVKLANNVSGNTFNIATGALLNIDGIISGAVGITKTGEGTLTLSGTNTYTDPTYVNEGVLSVSSLGTTTGASSLGNDNGISDYLFVRLGQLTSTGTLRYTGSTSVVTNRGIDMTGTTGGATLDASGTGAVTYGSFRVTGVGAKTLTLTGTSSALNTISAIVPDSSSGSTSLVKSDTGTWKLSGANTYSGGTTISGGTLLLFGASAKLGSGVVTVSNGTLGLLSGASIGNTTAINSGGKISGTGTISTLTVNNGGKIAPGDPGGTSIGTLTFSDLTLAGGSTYEWHLQNPSGTVGSGWDSITISSPTTLTFTADANTKFNLKLISLTSGGTAGTATGFTQQTYNWEIASSATIVGFSSGIVAIDSSDFSTNLGTGGTFALATQGTSLMLSFTPVPEPSTYVLMATGLSALAGAAWRRRIG